MAPKPQRGVITSFFKPASSSAPARRPEQPRPSRDNEPERAASPGMAKSPSSPPAAKSSQSSLGHPKTPVRPSAVVRRAAEIAASDEDDGLGSSSEDELEDLMAKFDPRRKASTNSGARGQQPSLLETPRAKRTMVSSAHSSPLTINTKPKFDLKALALDALEDEAAYAGALKVKKATEERNAAAISAAKRREGPSGTFMDMVQGKTGHDAQKVLRAVQRAESDQPRPRYCFWNPDFVAPNPSPPPKAVRSGPWRLLTEGTTQARERTLTSGLPLTLVQKRGMLPDELFCWILGELCVQRSVLMQDEYRNIICSCPEQVGRLLTADRLESLFMLQGADEDLGSWEDELKISIISEEPYKDKDWLQLRSLLQLLARIAENMSASAVTYAVQVLLRMSLDEFLILNIDVLMDYERAIASLIDAIPLSDWDSFCYDSSTFIHKAAAAQSVRVNALMCLPISSQGSHELRRRMAVALLSDDPSLSRHHPDDIITISGIIDRLGGDDFVVRQTTDFVELRACVTLLNIVVDDGSFVPTGDLANEKRFNEQIDDLAGRLRGIWGKIDDSGLELDRTEAKSVLDLVEKRLAHSVRTRRHKSKNPFDGVLAAPDPNLPKQQDFMKRFANGRLKKIETE